MSEAPSTSGRSAPATGGASTGGLFSHPGGLSLPGYTHIGASTIGQLSTTQLALTIAGAAVAGAVVWHYTRDAYYAYVPPRVSALGRERSRRLGGSSAAVGTGQPRCLPLFQQCACSTTVNQVAAAHCCLRHRHQLSAELVSPDQRLASARHPTCPPARHRNNRRARRVWPLPNPPAPPPTRPQYQYRPGTITGWMASLLARHAKRRRSRRPVRVYLDGCFDLMHYGHANALRQAKALGDELVVGLVPDREILRCKGPPILNGAERLKLVQSVKWVDEVLTGALGRHPQAGRPDSAGRRAANPMLHACTVRRCRQGPQALLLLCPPALSPPPCGPPFARKSQADHLAGCRRRRRAIRPDPRVPARAVHQAPH